MKTSLAQYICIWPDGTAKILEYKDIEYPAEKTKGCIAIIEYHVYSGKGIPSISNEMVNVHLWPHYRAGHINIEGSNG